MSLLRDLIVGVLPWYQPEVEQKRDEHTAKVIRRSRVARQRAERIIAEYRAAEKASGQAGDELVREARR